MSRVILTFGHSRSPRYGRAVALAKTCRSYKHDHDTGAHSIDEPLSWSGWRTLWTVAEIIHDWTNSTIESDGDNPFMAFAEMESMEACHRDYLSHPDKIRHCAGQTSPTSDPCYFGCRYVVGVRLVRTPESVFESGSPGWWEFGALDPDCKSLLVDRNEILKVLLESNAGKPCTLCTAHDVDLVAKLVRSLPSVIEVGEDWRLRRSMLDTTRPIGIEPNPQGYIGTILRGQDNEG